MNSWTPGVLVGVVLAAIYLLPLHHRPETLPGWPRWRTIAWLLGTTTVVVALVPPLTVAAATDHRAHMIQHLLLGMYAPLALVAAAPVSLLLGSLSQPSARRLTTVLRGTALGVLTHPVVAAVLNVGAMFVIYLTPVHLHAARIPMLGALVLLHFLLAGWLYTWSIAGPDPSPRRPGVGTRLAVLVLAAGAHAYLAKLLYARTVDTPHHDHATEHAAAGAQLMYYGGDGAEVLLAVMLLAGWYHRSRPRATRPAGQ